MDQYADRPMNLADATLAASGGLTFHATRPPSTARPHGFTQVDGPVLGLPPPGTVLRQRRGVPPIHPTDPLVAALPVQRHLGPEEVTELVATYRQHRRPAVAPVEVRPERLEEDRSSKRRSIAEKAQAGGGETPQAASLPAASAQDLPRYAARWLQSFREWVIGAIVPFTRA